MATVPPILPSLGISSSEPSEAQKIQHILNRHFADVPNGMPVGCNIMVMHEGETAYELRGGGIPLDAPQHWGSVSKQFTAACIVKLVEMGCLKFEDDIRTICPDLPEFEFLGFAQKISIDDLLHMRSGLPDVWNVSLISGRDPELLNNDELLALLAKHPGMVDLPGTKFMYCNTNYFLLAKIVEKVAKEDGLLNEEDTFVDFVRAQVFRSLGMSARCSADNSRVPTTNDAIGFGPKPKYQQSTKQIKAYGATGVVGPPSDMVHWNEALARGEFDALLEPPKDVVLDKRTYCRGLNIEDIGDYRRISHSGLLTGYVSVFRRYVHQNPQKTFAYFLATNCEDTSEAEKIADEVADVLAGKKLIGTEKGKKLEPNPVPGRIDEALDFDGAFTCVELGTDWDVWPQLRDEKSKIWEVHMRPSDCSDRRTLSEDLTFIPIEENEKLVFQLPGVFQIERTQEGFVCTGEKMAPLHFIPKSPTV